MVKPVSGGVEVPQTVEIPEGAAKKEMPKGRIDPVQDQAQLKETLLLLREAKPVMPKGAQKAIKIVNKGVEKLDKAANFLEKNEVGAAAKAAKGAVGDLTEAVKEMKGAEGKAKLGFVKKLAVALLKVATSLTKLCEFLAGLTLEVLGEKDKSTVAKIARAVQAITKPINEFVKKYEEKAKAKEAGTVEAEAEVIIEEVEAVAEDVEGMVEDLVAAE